MKAKPTIAEINAHTARMLDADKLRLPMGNSIGDLINQGLMERFEIQAFHAPFVGRTVCQNTGFAFLGEMHLEGMHEQECAFFDELLRENDLSLEDVGEGLASFDALCRA